MTNVSLTISWISFYAGNHEVCYRVQGSGDPYTCITVTCPGSGASCQHTANTSLDDEQCEDLTLEYYVRASCDESAQTPLTVVFTPEPACKKYETTCTEVSLAAITVTDGGDGYSTIPAVTIDAPAGVLNPIQATATAVLDGFSGEITTLGPFSAGGGWTASQNVIGHPLSGGTGTGATADVTTDGAGNLTSVVLNSGGTGYTVGDIIVVQITGALGTGTGGAMTVDAVFGGVVTLVNLNVAGDGYIGVPAITIDAPGSGTQATATALITDCIALSFNDCAKTSVSYEEVSLGTTINFCKNPLIEPITSTNGYSDPVENGNCLCNCVTADLNNTGGGSSIVNLTYTQCDGTVIQVSLLGSAPALTGICLIEDSLTYTTVESAVLSVTIGAPCNAAV